MRDCCSWTFALLCCYCCTEATLLPTDEAALQRALMENRPLDHLDLNFENREGKVVEPKDDVSAAVRANLEVSRVKMTEPTDLHVPVRNVDDTDFDDQFPGDQPDVDLTTNRTTREESDDEESGWTKAQQWGYAVMANSFNVCLSLSGIMIVKCSNGGNRRVLGDFFLGLAVSIMLGDSLLHIMPEVLDLKNEGDGTADDVQEESEYYLVIAKMGTVLGTVYLFWFLQSLMKLIGCGHSHDHNETGDLPIEELRKNSQKSHSSQGVESVAEPTVEIGWSDAEGPNWSIISGMVFGDCCCNFSDGLVIGVAWTLSWAAGLGTTLAIVLHKLPNELGDFIVYKKLGLSTRMALGLNLFAAMISFVGLFISLALATETDGEEWLLALVAGLFIFIPIFNIMPQMKLEKDTEDKTLRFVVQNLGMTSGFTIMVLLAIFEDDITNI